MHTLAVIGSNFVTDWLIEASRELPGAVIGAVLSRSRERGEAYAQKHSIPRVFTDIQRLCQDQDIDAVYIASPNSFHEQQAISLLNAGKHVLCEKPITTTAASLARMEAAAKRSGCVLMEAMVCAHLPCYREIQSYLDDIGPIRRASITFCQYSSRYDKFKNGIVENAFNPALGNGALFDLGVYCLHVAQMLFGPPDAVSSLSYRIPGSIGGAGAILLSYPGAVVDEQYSKVSQGKNPTEIQGENGNLLIDSLTRPEVWTLCRRGSRRADGLIVPGAAEEVTALSVKPSRHPMAYELDAFLQQIDGARNPKYMDDTREVVQVMDTVQQSFPK